jgi:hypothetical protein
MWISEGELKAGQEEMKVILKVCLQKMEANPEEMKSVR